MEKLKYGPPLPSTRSDRPPVRSTKITPRWDTIMTVLASFILGVAVALAVALPIVVGLAR